MRAALLLAAVLVALLGPAAAIDNGLGLTPPMGWRSWNCFHGDVTQEIMESMMDAQTERWLSVNGKKMSLLDLGYENCGLDDNWQQCNAGVNSSFHDAHGNPIVNKQTFPDMKKMTSYGQSKGLRVGWYGNNCICSEHNYPNVTAHMHGDVNAVTEYGFNGIKLDGCGEFLDLTWWADLLNATGRPILIENCHWGGTVPNATWCPWNFFRTSGDIDPAWDSFFSNLQTTKAYQDYKEPLAKPGCWAYPDMLEVGNLATFEEDRAHFGAWCIVSSPLILGFNLSDRATYQRVWPIIANTEAIAVNQNWAGHPGMLVSQYNPPGSNTTKYLWGIPCNGSDSTQQGWSYDASSKAIKAGNGQCVDGTHIHELTLAACNGQSAQQFTWQSNGQVQSVAHSDHCIDVYNTAGPVVQLYGCHDGANEYFNISASGVFSDAAQRCIGYKDTAPSGESGALIQIWAKPQPKNAVAVLILNSDTPGMPGTSHTVKVDFKALNLTSSSAAVRDIWNHKDLGHASDAFTTDAIPGHDSRFYLFTPQ